MGVVFYSLQISWCYDLLVTLAEVLGVPCVPDLCAVHLGDRFRHASPSGYDKVLPSLVQVLPPREPVLEHVSQDDAFIGETTDFDL